MKLKKFKRVEVTQKEIVLKFKTKSGKIVVFKALKIIKKMEIKVKYEHIKLIMESTQYIDDIERLDDIQKILDL